MEKAVMDRIEHLAKRINSIEEKTMEHNKRLGRYEIWNVIYGIMIGAGLVLLSLK